MTNTITNFLAHCNRTPALQQWRIQNDWHGLHVVSFCSCYTNINQLTVKSVDFIYNMSKRLWTKTHQFGAKNSTQVKLSQAEHLREVWSRCKVGKGTNRQKVKRKKEEIREVVSRTRQGFGELKTGVYCL